MSKEVFKDLPGYEGLYQVSNIGKVKSLERTRKHYAGGVSFIKGRILKQSIDNCGYYLVNLTKNGKCRTYQIHQLIAMAFLGHKPNGYKLVVDHIDYNKLNNNVKNLQIITHRKNLTKDKFRRNQSSKFVGVTWDITKKKWRSTICVNGKTKYLGYYGNELEASESYQNELLKLNDG